MQTQICVGVRLGVLGDFREPGAGNHDAGRGGGAFIQGIETRGIFRVRDRKVVGMNDQKFGVARVAESFGRVFALGLRRVLRDKKHDCNGRRDETHTASMKSILKP